MKTKKSKEVSSRLDRIIKNSKHPGFLRAVLALSDYFSRQAHSERIKRGIKNKNAKTKITKHNND